MTRSLEKTNHKRRRLLIIIKDEKNLIKTKEAALLTSVDDDSQEGLAVTIQVIMSFYLLPINTAKTNQEEKENLLSIS